MSHFSYPKLSQAIFELLDTEGTPSIAAIATICKVLELDVEPQQWIRLVATHLTEPQADNNYFAHYLAQKICRFDLNNRINSYPTVEARSRLSSELVRAVGVSKLEIASGLLRFAIPHTEDNYYFISKCTLKETYSLSINKSSSLSKIVEVMSDCAVLQQKKLYTEDDLENCFGIPAFGLTFSFKGN